jgi:hypothetical protein
MKTAVMVRTELAQDDLDKPEEVNGTAGERAPFSAAPLGEASSNPSIAFAEPASAEEMAYQRDRYERGRSLHRAGNIATLIGGVAGLPLTFGFVVSALDGNDGLAAVMGVGLVGAVGAYYTGGILSSLGALNATRAVNAAFGTDVRTDLAVGGIVASSAGILLTPFVLGGFAPIVGIICGVVQLQQVDKALKDIGVAEFHIAPTPQGFAMSMRF